MLKRFIVLLILANVVLFSGCGLYKRIVLTYRGAYNKFVLYGRVLDQFDEPVANAKVKVGSTHANLFSDWGAVDKVRYLKTDTDGYFTVKMRAHSFSVDDITADSYEFSKRDCSLNDEYKDSQYVSVPDNPFVFRMRKILSSPEYLMFDGVNSGEYFSVRVNKTFCDEFPLFNNYRLRKKVRTAPDSEASVVNYLNRNNIKNDFRVEGKPVDDNRYQFRFIPLHQDSGVVASGELLQEAPESGYEDEAVIYIDISMCEDVCDRNFYLTKHYIYMKTEGGKFYSRLEIKSYLIIYPRGIDDLSVYIRRFTNPTGSRNVQY